MTKAKEPEHGRKGPRCDRCKAAKHDVTYDAPAREYLCNLCWSKLPAYYVKPKDEDE